MQYKHDPAGNIAEVVVTHPNGEQQRQVVEIGDMNRVESIHYEKAGQLEISYDRMGRAIQFNMGGDTISVEYEGPNRIRRIKSMRTGTEWSPDDSRRNEQITHPAQDARQELFHRDFAGYPHADYGIVQFGEFSIAMFAGDPLEREVAGLREARQLLETAEPLLANENLADMLEFEKPSNPVFQPLEYRSPIAVFLHPFSLKQSHPGLGLREDLTAAFWIQMAIVGQFTSISGFSGYGPVFRLEPPRQLGISIGTPACRQSPCRRS